MSKPEPKLTHMPEHIKQKITDVTPDMGTKIALGQLSKEFRDYAEKSPTNYTEVAIQLYRRKVAVRISALLEKPDDRREHRMHLDTEFYPHANGTLQKNPTSNWEKIIPEDDYRKAAVQYCLEVMGRLKTTIFEFYLGVNEEYPGNIEYLEIKFEEDRRVIMDETEGVLGALGRPLQVESLNFNLQPTVAQILQLLPYLKAGTLSDMKFHTNTSTPAMPLLNLDLLSETEQWKQAKKLIVSEYDISVSVEKLVHFDEIEMNTRTLPASPETIVETFMNHPSMQSVIIRGRRVVELTELAAYLEQFGVHDFPTIPSNVEIRKRSEPNTFMRIHFLHGDIAMLRFSTNPDD